MADAKICDRCGKTVEANIVQKIGFGAWRYSVFNPGVQRSSSYIHDLCTDCGEKMSRFLNGAELEGYRNNG